MIDQSWAIPTISLMGANFSVNQIVSDSIQLGLSNGALVLTIGFADNPQALVPQESGLPVISMSGFTVAVTLPIQFDQVDEYLLIGQPTVSVSGTWQANVFGFLVNLSSTVNNLIASNLAAIFNDANVIEPIDYGLNVEVRNLYPRSRITGLVSSGTTVTLNLESP